MARFFRDIFIAVAMICSIFALSGCCGRKSTKAGDKGKSVITVSIPPLYGLTKAIVGEDFNIEILLTEGAAPETFSPTIKQISAVQNSAFFFSCNLMEFEKVVTKRISAQKAVRVINTAQGCKLIENKELGHDEECNHSHPHAPHSNAHNKHSHHHHGAIDPHAWMSPFELEVMACNIGEAICEAYPDSVKYRTNLEGLMTEIEGRQVAYESSWPLLGRGLFLIYHPALSYLARDYGLQQISLENEGKNPTPASLAEVIDVVNKCGIKQMMYQVEYPYEIIKPIVDILGVNIVQINPLSANTLQELDRVINTISK